MCDPGMDQQRIMSGLEIFFMLNLIEHKIKTAHKYHNSQNLWNFQVKIIQHKNLWHLNIYEQDIVKSDTSE